MCVHTHRFINYMPIAYSAVTLAVQKKETMDAPIFNFIRLQVTVMVSKKDFFVESNMYVCIKVYCLHV